MESRDGLIVIILIILILFVIPIPVRKTKGLGRNYDPFLMFALGE